MLSGILPHESIADGGNVNGSRRFARFVFIAGTAVLAACGDSSLAPRASAPDATIPGGGATAALSGWDTLRFSFTIDPSRNTTYWLGLGNSIVFPAGSLCDPSTSSYGSGQWDQPCAIAAQPVTVNAKAWLDAQGHPRIDFDRHIRFAPSSDPAKWVVLSFTDYRGALAAAANIVYCASAASDCVDEAQSDPSLVTYTNAVTGQLMRRIKHFSGYNVFAGRADISIEVQLNRTAGGLIMPNPGMSAHRVVMGDDEGGNSRQGYMLAWGRSDRDQ
jgi:hypothetical protein